MRGLYLPKNEWKSLERKNEETIKCRGVKKIPNEEILYAVG